jgi:DNA replication initiation complex subunit (GINS family)
MLDYNELYEYVRKEKYGEQLQPLSKQFITDVAEFFNLRRKQMAHSSELFSEEALREKKQFENSLAIFRELIRIRKKKILNLVFVASETGIMKRDFTTMLTFEQELFERLVSAIGDADKALQNSLHGSSQTVAPQQKMIIVTSPIAEFVDMSGSPVGPFDKGVLVNLDAKIADILISEGKAAFVDNA